MTPQKITRGLRVAAAALIALGLSASAWAQNMFYREVEKEGRLYVFAVTSSFEAFEKSGEAGKAITRLGYGPTGQTVIFDSEDAINLYNFKHNLPGEVFKKPVEASAEPAALHFKGITLTPGGFAAAETVWRQRALSADVNTPFNATPYPGASQYNISEFNASGRQSRISMLAEGKLKTVKIGSYYEFDFLSAGTTSNDNQSNSFTARQRQFWAQAKWDSGSTFTGGQMWSLITETTKGLDNRSEALPAVIDAQYTVGFSWARQFGLRYSKSFKDKVFFGIAIEEAQTTFTVHGNPTSTSGGNVVLVPTSSSCPTQPCTATINATTNVNFLLGQAGASGGLYNSLANYSYNPGPDYVAKLAFEPGFGHYEIFGVLSQFRDRAFPCVATPSASGCGGSAASAAGAFNDSQWAGGGGANARVPLFKKHVDLAAHFMAGNGIGRYGVAGLPDGTIKPDGTIALLKNYQGLGTLLLHPTPNFDINLYWGIEHSDQGAFLVGSKGEGYGSPLFSNVGCYTETVPTTATPAGTTAGAGYVPGALGNCTGDTRKITESSVELLYRFYKGSKGTVQFAVQYSHYERDAWKGVGGAAGSLSASGEPKATQNMVFTSFRYYIP
jgi:hypothetical protein